MVPAAPQYVTNPNLAVVESLSRSLDGKARVITAVRGIVPAAIAMPLVLSVWSPTWFVVSWMATYLSVSAIFVWLAYTRHTTFIEQTWSMTVSAVFCAVPISTVVFSGRAEDFWAAGMVGVIFIAFEMSALPFLHIGEWRAGVSMVGISVVVCGVLMINPIVALALAPILVAMILSSDRIRKLKMELEGHLFEAQRTIRHDPLTGLLNRRGLAACVEELDGQPITIALVDVDHFKMINDSHGHQVGDQVLMALADELSNRFGDAFSIARLGGDEFVAITGGTVELDPTIAAPAQVTTQILGQDFLIGCGLSIGVSSGLNTDSAERLLSEAGFAMRESKRSTVALSQFDDSLANRLDRTVQVAAIATGSGLHGDFMPVAQTIVDRDRIVGVELLIRWQRPNGELLEPDQFLPEAIDAGLMSIIDNMMLEHAVRFAARFNNRPDAPFVSVNISAPHLGEAGFCQRVEGLLTRHRVPANRLMIEITENEQLTGYSGWETAASRLRSLGVKLAIDDFGTGYSSIERLQHLPITHLKFDRSLVQAVSGPSAHILRGVAGFARAVNMGIIAEGVETLDELESVRAFDIAMFQGYLFHRPAALDAVEVRVIEDYVRVSSETAVHPD